MPTSKFVPEVTADGSCTFFSEEFGEWFHSRQGAYQEAQITFIEPTQVALKAQQPTIHLLDVCYGLGYNTAAALETIWRANPACQVKWIGLEFDPDVPRAAIAHHLVAGWTEPIRHVLEQLATMHQVEQDRLQAQLLIGDARQTIQQVQQMSFQADAIFLDPFSPPRCPILWTVEFLSQVAQCLKTDGRLATYSCAAAVRTALLQAGLHLGSTRAVGRQWPGTVASFTPIDLAPLTQREQEHLQTRAAVPYRDPTLSDTVEKVVERRQQEQSSSSLQPTSHWRSRWLSPSSG